MKARKSKCEKELERTYRRAWDDRDRVAELEFMLSEVIEAVDTDTALNGMTMLAHLHGFDYPEDGTLRVAIDKARKLLEKS